MFAVLFGSMRERRKPAQLVAIVVCILRICPETQLAVLISRGRSALETTRQLGDHLRGMGHFEKRGWCFWLVFSVFVPPVLYVGVLGDIAGPGWQTGFAKPRGTNRRNESASPSLYRHASRVRFEHAFLLVVN